MGFRRQRMAARAPRGIPLQQFGVVQLDHAAAGTRRHHHIIERLEGGDQLLGECRCVLWVAGIVGRLAAAALGRDFHIASRLLQKLGGGESDLRTEHVGKAGDDEADSRTGTRARAHRAFRGPRFAAGFLPRTLASGRLAASA